MSQSSKNKTTTNPALEAIAFMVGEWDMELSNAFFLPSKEDVAHVDVTFRWIEGGALLVLQQGDRSTPPFATWVIGRDEDDKEYTVHYFDDRKVSRVYRMSFEEMSKVNYLRTVLRIRSAESTSLRDDRGR